MSNQELNSLDDFQRFVSNTIRPWSRERRIALAAATTERWLPVCESFSEEEEWGDPSVFQRAVEAIWNCALGKNLSAKDHRLHKKHVEENTPHIDDFDAEEVIATSGMIYYALNCCVSDDNTDDVVMAMVSGLEAVAPGIYSDADEVASEVLESPEFHNFMKKELKPLVDNLPPPDEQEMDTYLQKFMSLPAVTDEGVGPLPPDVWESPQVRKVMEKSVKLQKRIGDIFPIIAQKIEALRQTFETPETKQEAEQGAREIWQLPQVQDELKKQLELLKLIGDMAQIDQQQIKALRGKLGSSQFVGIEAPRPDPRMTNEAVFEQYRRLIESDLKNQYYWEKDEPYLNAVKTGGMLMTQYFGEWASRYSRRKSALDNPMNDLVGRKALLTRYSKNDAAVQGDPGWDQETRSSFEIFYPNLQHMENGFDAKTPDEIHSYGPSLRHLCTERRLAGDSDQEVWDNILQWARHRPPMWEEEDRRKKKKLAYTTPELGDRLTREVSWRDTDDVNYPWVTEVAGETWRVRLNDFPDEVMYTLIINDAVTGSFHDWPECWQR